MRVPLRGGKLDLPLPRVADKHCAANVHAQPHRFARAKLRQIESDELGGGEAEKA
jgi:hypothetical protein